MNALVGDFACLRRVANSSELRFLLLLDGMLCIWFGVSLAGVLG